MYAFLFYNLKAALCLVVFLLFYKLVLSRETFHRLNRLLLLGGIALSFILPLCVITVEREMPVLPKMEVLAQGSVALSGGVSEVAAIPEPVAKPFAWEVLFAALFVAGMVVTAGWTCAQIVRTMRVIRRGRLENLENGVVLSRHANLQSPFSWGRWIVISDADAAECGPEILAHEQAHIRCGHTIDLLFCDVVRCLQWFNPAMWLLRGELRILHEYEADEAVLAAGIDARQYQLLLIKKAVGGRWYSVASSLNHSKLKNRITMMLRKRSSGWARARALIAVPLVCLALGAFARTTYVYQEDKGMENVEIKNGFSGQMAIESNDGGVVITVDGRGDAASGGAALVVLVQQQEFNPDKAWMAELVHLLMPFIVNPDSAALGYPRPLCLIDGKRLGAEEALPGAERIAQIELLGRAQGAAVYGADGANGAVLVTTRFPGAVNARLKELMGREDEKVLWFEGDGLALRGELGFEMRGSVGGASTDERKRHGDSLQRAIEQLPDAMKFGGKIGVRVEGNDRLVFRLYGRGDVMMAANSLISHVFSRNLLDMERAGEFSRIVYRLSRSAGQYPGLLRMPMTLCLVDGSPVATLDEVPDADRIARMEVLDGKRGAAEYGAAGANGVVLITSKDPAESTLQEVEAWIAEGGDRVIRFSCMSETDDSLEEPLGYYAGAGYLLGVNSITVVDGRENASLEGLTADRISSLKVYTPADMPEKYKGYNVEFVIEIVTKQAAAEAVRLRIQNL